MTAERAVDRVIDALNERDCKPRQRGRSWSARCPAHVDRNPSLSVTGISGRVLIYCHTGCATKDVVAALGLEMKDLYDDAGGMTYRYPGGRIVRRTPIKRFWQEGDTADRSLYRQPEVEKAVAADQVVYVVEGENDAQALHELAGVVATTSPQGAGKWSTVDPSPLAGARVVVVADDDDPGRCHAAQVKASLEALDPPATVTVVKAAEGKDAADHLTAGHTAAEFVLIDADPWTETPTPLTPNYCPVPFPTQALPRWLRDMVEAEAEATQTDAGMAGSVALGVLAAAAGGRARVEVRPGWIEPCNIFTCSVAEPGSRKSSVFATMIEPLGDAEKELVGKDADLRWMRQMEYEVEKTAADKLQQEAAKLSALGVEKKSAARDKLSEAQTKREHAESIEVPIEPRLLADDCTPEALVSLLTENKGRIAVVSAEGGLFGLLAGRYSRTPNLDPILKGHAGDRIRVDRKGRSTEFVDRPALTLALTVQPAVIEQIGRNGDFTGRGLLARFLYSIPPDRVGYRKIAPPPVPADIAAEYARRVHDMVKDLEAWADDPMVLTFTDEAARLFLAAETELEPRLAGDLRPIKEWASKLMGAVARIAGLLHLAQYGADIAMRRSVSAETITAALAVGNHYMEHALVIFGVMSTDPAVRAAKDLRDHIERHGIDEASIRDLHANLTRSRFPKPEDVAEALAVLVEHGWALPLPTPHRAGPGRKPSPRFRFRPSA